MKYFKQVGKAVDPEYYRVFPFGYYEYRHKYQDGWQKGVGADWKLRYEQFKPKPREVSKLEVLIVFGPEAVNRD